MTGTDVLSALASFMRSIGAPVGELVPLRSPSERGDQYVAVRNDYRLDRLPAPRKTKRAHTFHDLRSFAEWLVRFGKTPDEVEILVGETEAHAVLGPHPDAARVTCELRDHPMFAAWKRALGVPMDPLVFHAFVRSVQGSFAPPGEDGPNFGDQLLAELVKLKVVIGTDVDHNIDPRGYYTLHGAKGNTQIDAKIDPNFTVWTPLLLAIPGEPPDADADDADREVERRYKLGIVLTLEVSEKAMRFKLTCPGLAVVQHQARMDAVDYLRELLGANAPGSFLVGLGDEETTVVEG